MLQLIKLMYKPTKRLCVTLSGTHMPSRADAVSQSELPKTHSQSVTDIVTTLSSALKAFLLVKLGLIAVASFAAE